MTARTLRTAKTWPVVDALITTSNEFALRVLPNVGHGAIGHPYAPGKLNGYLRESFGLPRAARFPGARVSDVPLHGTVNPAGGAD